MESFESYLDNIEMVYEGGKGYSPCTGDILIASNQFTRHILYGGVKSLDRDESGNITKAHFYSNGVQFVVLRGGRVENPIGVRMSFTYGLNARNCHRQDGQSDQPQFDGSEAYRGFNDTYLPEEGAEAVAIPAFTGAYKIVRICDFVHLGTKNKVPTEYKVSVPTLQKLDTDKFNELCNTLQSSKAALLAAFRQKLANDISKFLK